MPVTGVDETLEQGSGAASLGCMNSAFPRDQILHQQKNALRQCRVRLCRLRMDSWIPSCSPEPGPVPRNRTTGPRHSSGCGQGPVKPNDFTA